ncbi:hypothetical protein BKA93DRAFT_766686 [Sparassis latifolia]
MPSMLDLFKRHKTHSTERAQAHDDADDVARRLASFTLRGDPDEQHRRHSDQNARPGGFVGGFSLAVPDDRVPLPPHDASADSAWTVQFPAPARYGPPPPGPLPRPPAFSPMPVPQHAPQPMSMTMQHALAAPFASPEHASSEQHLRPAIPDVPTRPYSDPAVPTRQAASSSAERPPAPVRVRAAQHLRPYAPDISARTQSDLVVSVHDGAVPSSSAATQRSVPTTPRRPPAVRTPSSAPSKPVSSRGPPQRPPLQSPIQRRRAASSPPSSTSTSVLNTVQCNGTTKADKRCKKRVKVSPDADTELDQYFCHIHMKALLEPKEIILRTTDGDRYVKVADWIPEYLQHSTQANLRLTMEKPISKADVPGYIYTFEIRDPENTEHIQLKVGRAVKLTKRIDEWSKQCGSKPQVLRGYWPSGVDTDDGSLMKGRVRVGEKGMWCHRVERLVHLELADLAVNSPYLDDDFPKTRAQPQDTPTREASTRKKTPCSDCDKIHREIFTFARSEHSRYHGKEWESLVRPVIEKWGGFVEAYFGREVVDLTLDD